MGKAHNQLVDLERLINSQKALYRLVLLSTEVVRPVINVLSLNGVINEFYCGIKIYFNIKL